MALGDAARSLRRLTGTELEELLQRLQLSSAVRRCSARGAGPSRDVPTFPADFWDSAQELFLEFWPATSTPLARPLADLLVASPALSALTLACNDIGDSGAQDMAEALRFNSSLTALNLGYSGITNDGMCALADALRVNKTLTSLELEGNFIADAGVQRFADALRVNRALALLRLGGCNISDAGGVILARALPECHGLEQLFLGRNRLEAPAALALAEALLQNSTLQALDLARCEIGNDGFRALAEALATNTGLTSLWLGLHNLDQLKNRPPGQTSFFDDASTLVLANSLKVNTSLSIIDLGCCGVSETGAGALAAALYRNFTVTWLWALSGSPHQKTIDRYAQQNTNPHLVLQLRWKDKDQGDPKADLVLHFHHLSGARALVLETSPTTPCRVIQQMIEERLFPQEHLGVPQSRVRIHLWHGRLLDQLPRNLPIAEALEEVGSKQV